MRNKNILFLTPTDESQFLNFFTKELGQYVNDLQVLNVPRYFSDQGLGNTERHVRDLIADKRIDIVMSCPIATSHHLSVEFFASLKGEAKIVFWMLDDEMFFDCYSKYYGQVADIVVTGDYFSVAGYERIGIPAVNFTACFSRRFYSPIEINKDIDVCFLGNCDKADREDYINFLIENGISVETFGIGSKNGPVEESELPVIFSRSKINLDFTKPEVSWPNRKEVLVNRTRVTKGRWVEIALTKSFCLTEYAPSTNLSFEIGKEIDVFSNKRELLEKVRLYLANRRKREEIAENGYKRALACHEAESGIPRILGKLEVLLEKTGEQNKNAGGIYLSKNFKIDSISIMTFLAFSLIKKKKLSYALEIFSKLLKYGNLVFFQGFAGGLSMSVENICSKIFAPR